jgi:hypothetical protein
MMRVLRAASRGALLAAALMLAGQSAAQAQSKPFDAVGDFEYTTTVNGQTVTGVISITKKDDALTGKILSDMMPEIPITGVTVENNKITIAAVVPDAEGPLTIVLTFEDDNKFSGTWSLAGDGGAMAGKRKVA